LQDFKQTTSQLQFTLELGHKKILNLWNLAVLRNDKELDFSIYHKSTYTDSIIPCNWSHPMGHKFVALRFLIDRFKSSVEELSQYKNSLYPKHFVQ